MKAQDVMTSSVVSVRPDTSVRAIAAILVERQISGVPVVIAGSVVGIVTAGDLIRRHEIGTDRRGLSDRWWKRLISGSTGPREYVRSHALRASDVMTPNVFTVQKDASLAEVIDVLERHRIRRVPVLDGLRLVGIVSRSDVVRAFASLPLPGANEPTDDDSVRRRLLAELSAQSWWRDESSVTVSGGTVHYWGVLHSEDERNAARVAAQSISGVRRIRDHRVHVSTLSPMV